MDTEGTLKFQCGKCKTEWLDVSGRGEAEQCCPQCASRVYKTMGRVTIMNKQVHPVMRDILNAAVKPVRIHCYWPACDRDGLD